MKTIDELVELLQEYYVDKTIEYEYTNVDYTGLERDFGRGITGIHFSVEGDIRYIISFYQSGQIICYAGHNLFFTEQLSDKCNAIIDGSVMTKIVEEMMTDFGVNLLYGYERFQIKPDLILEYTMMYFS